MVPYGVYILLAPSCYFAKIYSEDALEALSGVVLVSGKVTGFHPRLHQARRLTSRTNRVYCISHLGCYLISMSTENPDAVFVKEYVKTGDAVLAFNRAGYPTGGVSTKIMAERTLARPEIALALEVLREAGVEKKEEADPLSREGLIDRLGSIYDVALDKEALPSAINAVKAQAQLLGYMDQVVTVNHNVTASELSLEELRLLVAKEVGPPRLEQRSIIEGEYTDV